MLNLNLEALQKTIALATDDPGAVKQPVRLDGEWQTRAGAAQFRASIPVPNGDSVTFEADFPPPMGGTGSAPNPLAYCFWGGLACYAMTFAQEAALKGVEVRMLRAHVTADVDQSRALGVTDNAPVESIDWYLDVDSDAPHEMLEKLKALADEHCPGVWCIRNPVDLHTHLEGAKHE